MAGLVTASPTSEEKEQIINGNKAFLLSAFHLPPFFINCTNAKFWQAILSLQRPVFTGNLTQPQQENESKSEIWYSDARPTRVAIIGPSQTYATNLQEKSQARQELKAVAAAAILAPPRAQHYLWIQRG